MAETVGLLLLSWIGITGAAATFTIGATGITLAGLVGTAALVGGSIGLNYLLAARVPLNDTSLPAPESGHQAIRQAIPPRVAGYGRNRLAGAYLLYEEEGGDSYDVQGFHHGRIGGVIGYYLHDDVVDVVGGVVQEQGDGRYGDNLVSIDTRLGLDTETAYAPIVSALPSVWTSAHRGDGIASASLICLAADDPSDYTIKYPRGKPELSVVADCSPIFDPRDSDQDREDPSTWLVSSNPVLQLLDILTNADRGMGLDWDILVAPVLEALMAEADLCDALVYCKDGSSEPRYKSDGIFTLDGDPVDVIAAILDTCDGWISENGDGSLALKVGLYRTPEFVLEGEHIKGFSIQYGVPDEEVVNELTLEYTSPSLDYKTAPGAPLRDEDDISSRGQVRSKPLALKWVQSHPQGQRLLKRKMAQLNAPLRGTVTTTMYGFRGLGERWIKIEAPEYPDFADLVIEVRGVTIDLIRGTLTFRFVSVDPETANAWDPATEEGDAPTIPEKLVSPPPPIPVIDHINAVLFVGSPFKFQIIIDDPGRSDLRYQARWRISGSGSAYTVDPLADGVLLVGGQLAISEGYGADYGNLYEVQLRSYAPSGLPSDWSTSKTVHT